MNEFHFASVVSVVAGHSRHAPFFVSGAIERVMSLARTTSDSQP